MNILKEESIIAINDLIYLLNDTKEKIQLINDNLEDDVIGIKIALLFKEYIDKCEHLGEEK